jgi:translation initiation factor 3 subunit H
MTTPVNFAAAAQQSGKKPPVRVVQLEGTALLKIAQHCKNAPSSAVVTGQLLGLDVGQTLEVTDCFPFPSSLGEDEGDGAMDGETYQLEMMRCLREINVDNNTVGWYQSTVSGSYQVVEIIETFVTYLENLERCICIVYDVGSSSGGAAVKALRLADSFVEAYREGTLTVEKIRAKSLSWQDVFVEIPVAVHNSPLTVALAAEVEPAAGLSQLDLDRLALGTNPALEKNMEFLNDCLDDLVGEQNKLSMYHNQVRRYQQQLAQWRLARRAENQARRAAGEEPLPEEPPEGEFKKPAEPSQLDNMLLSNQMSVYAHHIASAAAQGVAKLLLLSPLPRGEL